MNTEQENTASVSRWTTAENGSLEKDASGKRTLGAGAPAVVMPKTWRGFKGRRSFAEVSLAWERSGRWKITGKIIIDNASAEQEGG